ncbi:papain family cysteine protease [Oesophagostomum dentatum]|uniref:Papain family cysteine protease n=1 Tax=Oesophagostomum dentatum TaxID=61180 RepID=A0A0B1SMA0_OESDE|nr:papain family cysteine protease [Oesophagostomum dentatum]
MHGVCTGGPYGTKGVCKPYVFHPCGKHTGQIYYGECPATSYETPKCSRLCQRGYGIPYKKDKVYGASTNIAVTGCYRVFFIAGKNFYWLPNNETAIRKEIMTNGPVVGAFDTYEDFRPYGGGIYEHLVGERRGGHAVRIIGWGAAGAQMERKYWIIANSWNVDWGEKGNC